MNITGKLEINPKAFVRAPFSAAKTHCLVGNAITHINSHFEESDGEIETSNVNYIDVVDGVVYALTHSKSRYELVNIDEETAIKMVESFNESDYEAIIAFYSNTQA